MTSLLGETCILVTTSEHDSKILWTNVTQGLQSDEYVCFVKSIRPDLLHHDD